MPILLPTKLQNGCHRCIIVVSQLVEDGYIFMTMEIVGQYLQHEATQRSGRERDFFGRTAFNRYYYASYLGVKKTLGSLRKEWDTIAHADVPQLLRGTIKTELSNGRKKAVKAEDAETIEMCSRAINAVMELANLMEEGYATRVTADYTPGILIDFSTLHNFKLNTIFVKQAANWPAKARLLCTTIAVAWNQTNA
jgi:hypothetical protein